MTRQPIDIPATRAAILNIVMNNPPDNVVAILRAYDAALYEIEMLRLDIKHLHTNICNLHTISMDVNFSVNRDSKGAA